ncbi:MAG: peptidoglycan-binding protein, partial [Dehalococcoidales bacterium]
MKRISILIIILALASFMLLSIPLAAQYSQEVYQAQKTLKELGYNPGKADGMWGKATERAIKHFQVDTGLPVTGQLDEQTKAKLGIGPSERGIKVRGKRFALVIGNGAYKNIISLKNPINDANDMARALKEIGFTVTKRINAT